MKAYFLFVLAFITLVVVSIGFFSSVCLNPDCRFESLKTPVLIISITTKQVIAVDAQGTIWSSEEGWKTADALIQQGYRVGDTIGKLRR